MHQGQAAPLGHLGRGQVSVGIPHLARPGFFVQGDNLIPGRNNGHPGFFISRQASYAQGRQEADLLGAETPAGREEHLAPGHVLPGGEQTFAGGHGPAHLQGAVRVLGGVFDHHHRVGARGQHGAGGHPQGLAGTHAPGGGYPHGHLAFDFQVLGRPDAGPEGILGPDRVAVHGGAQKPRHILRRRDGRSQDPAAGRRPNPLPPPPPGQTGHNGPGLPGGFGGGRILREASFFS